MYCLSHDINVSVISNSLSLGTLQCRIIRTTELAAAREKLNELERRKDEILKKYAPASLVRQLNGKSLFP